MSLSPDIILMEQAARTAGAALVRHFKNYASLQIEGKDPGDFVSQADRESEDIIVNMLQAARPEWGILGEEGTDIAAGASGWRWIIEPLDGTTNFLHGVAHWSVTIALEKDGVIMAGLTFDPILDELFYAEKGQGAFLNGVPLRVASKDDFGQSMVSMNIGYSRNDPLAQKNLGYITEKIYQARGHIQNGGGLALEMAYVAAGRFDMAHCWLAQPWDLAAGLIIVEEAGGKVTNLDNLPLKVEKSGVLAGNSVLHSAYTKLLDL